MLWTDTFLHDMVREKLGNARLVVVANREPYSHMFTGAAVRCERPASGMVSALDPVLRACSGLWVAHGSGSADRLVVDQHDRVAVPPDNPQYTLKRVWLTKAEEAGYYYGFANDALWPLCHVVFARPRFVLSDWEAYVQVNTKFAHAILSEIHDEPAVVWIQDYHIYRWAGKMLSTLFTLQSSRCLTQEKDEEEGTLLAPIMNNLRVLEN